VIVLLMTSGRKVTIWRKREGAERGGVSSTFDEPADGTCRSPTVIEKRSASSSTARTS